MLFLFFFSYWAKESDVSEKQRVEVEEIDIAISLRYRFRLILKLTNESRAWDRRKRACRY